MVSLYKLSFCYFFFVLVCCIFCWVHHRPLANTWKTRINSGGTAVRASGQAKVAREMEVQRCLLAFLQQAATPLRSKCFTSSMRYHSSSLSLYIPFFICLCLIFGIFLDLSHTETVWFTFRGGTKCLTCLVNFC